MLLRPAETATYFRLSETSPDGAHLSGVLQSGGTALSTPLPGISVTLSEVAGADPVILDQATTDSEGRFTLHSPRVTTPGIFFVTANLRSGTELITLLGPVLPSQATVNELTTAMTSYAMAQWLRSGGIRGDTQALRIAFGMYQNLVNPVTGASSLVLLTSPNADESNALRSTRSLANLIAACVADPDVADRFRSLTQEPGKPVPAGTLQAMANLARNPGQDVLKIDALTHLRPPFLPALERPPDAWTVAVKVNDSGDDNHLIGGVGFLVFDADGYAWISDNTVQGTPYSSRVLLVMQPNGMPASGVGGHPRSPIYAEGGILGGGYGLTIDPEGKIWVGNFGWGPETNCIYYPSPECGGSISLFTPGGVPLSGPNGIQGGPNRAQGMAADAAGNIWICSFGDDSVYVFLGGKTNDVASLKLYEGSQPFGLQIAKDGTAWVTSGGGISGTYPSTNSHVRLVGNQLEIISQVGFGKAIKGLSIDSLGNVWVASQGDSKVYAMSADGVLLGGFDGGGVDGPWGVTVDGEDNIWVSDFGPLGVSGYSSRISKLAGANPATRPPNLKLGDPISPSSGYTLPTAGSPVLLHNGTPLYGPGSLPAYDPLQRITMNAVDRAGNLWVLNNWKNRFLVDFFENPGGDGVVIFVGLAAPLP